MIELCEICDLTVGVYRILREDDKEYTTCHDCLQQRLLEGEYTYDDLEETFVVELIEETVPLPLVKKVAEKEKKELKLQAIATELTVRTHESDPIIGRMKEINHAIRVLGRKGKNNPVLIGEPGVGKTAIATGLAQRIIKGDVPHYLQNKRIFSLAVSELVAGTKYRGEFEQKIQDVMKEIKTEGNIILFIDEIHTVIGAGGSDNGIGLANILKPALSNGEITVIGATTEEEYRTYIEKDNAMERRFQRVQVNEPSKQEVMDMLRGLRMYYEKHHGVWIGDEILGTCVDWADQHIQYRNFPDKAIDLLDEACVYAKTEVLYNEDMQRKENELFQVIQEKKRSSYWMKEKEAKQYRVRQLELEEMLASRQIKKDNNGTNTVEVRHVARVISEWTGIEVDCVQQSEKEKLKQLASKLKQRVIGQDEAVDSIVKAVRRNKMGVKEPNRPVGVFVSMGPSGTGKTHLAKELAKELYGSEKRMLRFDMSEYMDKSSVNKLIGANPGYVGYQEGGKLTTGLKRNPNCVVLFDEIEKAHPDVFLICLQLFEEGRLTDNTGRVIDGTHALFIMTTNIGSDQFKKKKSVISLVPNEESEKWNPREELRTFFPPELVNRIDGVLVFQPLSIENKLKITRLMLQEWKVYMKGKGYTVSFHASVATYIQKKVNGTTEEARAIRNAIREMQDAVINEMLEQEKTEFKISVKEEGFVVR